MKQNRFVVAAVLAVVVMLFTGSGTAAQTKQEGAKATAAAKTTDAKAPLIDINTASKAELTSVPGIGDVYSQKIIDGRPYTRKDQLVSKKIVPQATYDRIKDLIVAKQAGSKKK